MSAEPVGECVDGLDEPACDVAAAPRLGGVEVLQVAGRVRGPRGGMQAQVRQPGQADLTCSATSPCTAEVGSHSAARVRSVTSGVSTAR